MLFMCKISRKSIDCPVKWLIIGKNHGYQGGFLVSITILSSFTRISVLYSYVIPYGCLFIVCAM